MEGPDDPRARQELADRIGTALVPVLERLSAVLTPIMDNIGRWGSMPTRNWPPISPSRPPRSRAFLVVLAPLAMALGGLMGGFGLLAGGLGLIASPVGLAIAAIGALILVFTHWDETVALVKAAWQGLIDLLGFDPVALVTAKFNALVAYLGGLATSLWTAGTGIGSAIVNGIVSGLGSAWEGLKAKASELASSLPEWVRGPLGIQSPSRVFAGLGENIVRGLEVGIAARERMPGRALAGLAGGLTGAVGAVGLGLGVTAMPAAASLAGPGPGGASISMPITIHITAPAGTDAQGLADLVQQAVAKSTRQAAGRLGALYDSTDGL